MTYETLELFIDGKWTQGTSGITQDVINPATEELVADVQAAGESAR